MRKINGYHLLENSYFFTLVELLMVIAIISVLAGMLLPALSNARDASQQIACVSNLKQIKTGIIFYTDDYDNYLPQCNSGAPGFVKWQDYLYPYIYHYSGVVIQSIALDISAGVPKGVFKCPSQETANYYAHYGINYWISTFAVGANRKITKIRVPTKRCLVGDSSYTTDTYIDQLIKWSARHSGGSNFLYVDGHVDWILSDAVETWNGDYFWGYNCD